MSNRTATGADGEVESERESAINLPRLLTFLEEVLGRRPTELTVDGYASGGSSNITAFLTVDGKEWVLRRPPVGDLRPTAHDMIREYRFVAALQGTAVPLARTIAACEDVSVIGAPFYLAERVRGEVLQNGIPQGFEDPAEVAALAYAAVDTLAAIHAVPWTGLDVPYRPGDYLERQLRRWTTQLERTPTASRLPGLAEVTQWLHQHRPNSTGETIVHGDFGLHNMIVAAPPNARVLAVLDWEMATIGDPLADLAWFLSGWGRSQQDGGVRNPANVITTWPGAPTAAELQARYETTSGRAMEHWQFYEAFTMWKGAIITEGLYSDFVAGTAANPAVIRFETEVPRQVATLCEMLGL